VTFVLGIVGSVAVGKSTIAEALRGVLVSDGARRVEVVSSDSFLLPRAELERRWMMDRKGFPESYDQAALFHFLIAVRDGGSGMAIPTYSHLLYDVVPDTQRIEASPDVLILEGLNLLQPPPVGTDGDQPRAIADLLDLSIYVDAEPADLEGWYVERFLSRCEGAEREPGSHFDRYVGLGPEERVEAARDLWRRVNAPNLERNIEPTRSRADVVLHLGADRRVDGASLGAERSETD
jgi:type I pantothenate kinase